MPPDLIQWGIREGGTILVVLVLLYFYRKDWMTSSEYWKSQNAITTDLVTNSVRATSDLAAAIRENTTVTHGLKRIVELSLLNPDHLRMTAEECEESPADCPIKRRARAVSIELDRERDTLERGHSETRTETHRTMTTERKTT